MPRSDRSSDLEKQVEELLRLNAELAAEIRNLTLDRVSEPRSSPVPAARKLARHDALLAEVEEARSDLEAVRSQMAHFDRHNRELRDLVEEQNRELTRLRSGFHGVLRRARARLLRR